MDPIITSFDSAFAALDRRSRTLLDRLDGDLLFARIKGSGDSMSPASCGEYLLRSAGAVEQTFDGLTTRLWDDPFEWTLPEKLSTKPAVLQYLDEVEATRLRGFAFLNSDADLSKQVPAPEQLRSLAEILTDTLTRASHLQGRSFAIYQVITGDKPPRL